MLSLKLQAALNRLMDFRSMFGDRGDPQALLDMQKTGPEREDLVRRAYDFADALENYPGAWEELETRVSRIRSALVTGGTFAALKYAARATLASRGAGEPDIAQYSDAWEAEFFLPDFEVGSSERIAALAVTPEAQAACSQYRQAAFALQQLARSERFCGSLFLLRCRQSYRNGKVDLGAHTHLLHWCLPVSRTAKAVQDAAEAVCIFLQEPQEVQAAQRPLPAAAPAAATDGGRDTSAPASGEDFRSLSWCGKAYVFSVKQAKVVEKLYKAHQRGTPDVHHRVLLDAAECGRGHIRDIMKHSQAWKDKAIASIHPGFWRLQPPPAK